MARGDSAVSCPFDERRSGFVMSEGAGLVFMERLTDAMERGSNVYAEIIGFGWVSMSSIQKIIRLGSSVYSSGS